MPRIIDNIHTFLLPTLRETIDLANRADFCVGYFNLRGWKQIDSYIDRWGGGSGQCCRLLVGMQRAPEEELRAATSVIESDGLMDNQTALRLKRRLAEEFRNQLTLGVPTNEDEAGLRRLAAQIKAKKVVVRLFLKHPLHAKLYLLYRQDPINPIVGYLGSSNLTFAGLSHQGELNVDVLDRDACTKLSAWFEERWNEKWCIDISDELVQIIEESWAREDLVPPYHIYVKMAYHLSQEARAGLSEFAIPRDFGDTLFDYQKAAVKIAAHHLNKRSGVLIGDVVGLGKTLMATALARIFEDDFSLETLIICPPNLITMWDDYRQRYRLRATILSRGRAIQELPNMTRHRLVIIDESHNFRNREGRTYGAIADYINKNESRVILLSATPYNKTYTDLSSQLRLFVAEDQDLGIRPERLLREIGETEFIRRHQAGVRTLAAFEHSPYADDWRDLMRLYLVRRTRSFIQDNYAEVDADGRKYLTFADGTRSYFPTRTPRTVKFRIDDADPTDQYARLYAQDIVDAVNALRLPRYGLGNYTVPDATKKATAQEKKVLEDLGRAGTRLMGFTRTNLFKRLESSGAVFVESLERHILRNYIYLHAIEHGQPVPIGTQDVGLLDSRLYDEDADTSGSDTLFDGGNGSNGNSGNGSADHLDDALSAASGLRSPNDYRRWAAQAYEDYRRHYATRFKWLSPNLFTKTLGADLLADAGALLDILSRCGQWDADRDAKLQALLKLLTKTNAGDKVLIFSQFADTVRYLERQLRSRGVQRLAAATGRSSEPTMLAWQFSPVSNNKRDQIRPEAELRVLIATDVLSEGQNLQDCHIVVNYDLPWAIIRLIQRVGRVDRIGQKSPEIVAHTFLPAEGVERIIKLRDRVRRRLQENAEVLGTDEAFFEDDKDNRAVVDLYNENAGLLDADADGEVDLASYAYQIWKNAVDADPRLQKLIPDLPNVAYATKALTQTTGDKEGVLVYMRTPQGNDALAWINERGNTVTESQLAILKAAECKPDTEPLPRIEKHHELVERGVSLIVSEETTGVGGQLGRPSGARFRTYERLKNYVQRNEGTLFVTDELRRAVEEIYRFPLRETAKDSLNRQMKAGASDEELVSLVLGLRSEDRLCIISDDEQVQEPRIICSMGLAAPK